MAVRADAHLHFFEPGYVAVLPESCRRITPDEVTLYQALAQQHNVEQVLAVGYEGESWAAENNKYLAQLAADQPWLKPVAFVHHPATIDIAALENWQQQRFVGLSFYIFNDQHVAALSQVTPEVWAWLVQQRWLLSINSRGQNWSAWMPILENQPELRLLVSHLGLPQAVAQPPTIETAQKALAPVLSLAQFPGVHVKLSAFYALTEPGYDYPHQAAWSYVEALLAAFGSSRLIWGSDFSPSLEWVSFPQTLGLLSLMSFLTATDLEQIEGGNLLNLLADIATL